jgi:hypothetical protein
MSHLSSALDNYGQATRKTGGTAQESGEKPKEIPARCPSLCPFLVAAIKIAGRRTLGCC